MEAKQTITAEAESLVMGERGEDYGHPLDDYTRTASLWNALLGDKLREPITAQDAIRCMCAVKLSRDVNRPKRDNRVALAGYALCLQRADDEEQRRVEAGHKMFDHPFEMDKASGDNVTR